MATISQPWIVFSISGGVFNGTARFSTRRAALEHCIQDAEECRSSDDPEWHIVDAASSEEPSFSFGFYDPYDYGADVDPRALCIADMRELIADESIGRAPSIELDESGEPTNAQRAEWGARAIATNPDDNGNETNLFDVLANLRHYAQREGLAFDEIDARANAMFAEEPMLEIVIESAAR